MSSDTLPVFDPAQLARRTRGNPSLRVEVLSLFIAEAERLMRQVEDAPDAEVRAQRLRALTHSARDIGAALLAHEARTLETQIAADVPDLAPLRSALETTLTYVRNSAF